MQIMRFVVFFIQEYLYSNILANSIFIRYHRIKMLDFIRCQRIKTFMSNSLFSLSYFQYPIIYRLYLDVNLIFCNLTILMVCEQQ